MKTMLLLGVLLSGSAFATAVTGVTCPSASLNVYASSFSGSGSGCTVGPVGFYGFSYSPVNPASGSSLDGQDLNILVQPLGGGLSISSPFSSWATLPSDLKDVITGGFPVSWLISYWEDPAPILTGEELTLDPPSGMVTITETISIPCDQDLKCESSVFVISVTPEFPTASVIYPQPVSRVYVELLVELSGNFQEFGGSVSTPIVIPEPGTAALAAFGVIALFGLRRLRK